MSDARDRPALLRHFKGRARTLEAVALTNYMEAGRLLRGSRPVARVLARTATEQTDEAAFCRRMARSVASEWGAFRDCERTGRP